jgi:hypothetical protein
MRQCKRGQTALFKSRKGGAKKAEHEFEDEYDEEAEIKVGRQAEDRAMKEGEQVMATGMQENSHDFGW